MLTSTLSADLTIMLGPKSSLMTLPVTVILCIRILPMSSLATTPSPFAAARPSAAFMETPVSFSVSALLMTAPMAPLPSSMTIFILRSGTPST